MASSKRSPEQGGTAAPLEPEPAPAASPALDLLEAEIVAALPPEPPRPSAPASSTAGPDDEGETLGQIEGTLNELGDDPSKLGDLTEEELADLWQLIFGLVADERGSHWEVDRKRSLRLGTYTRKTLDKYGGVPESWAKHIPAVILAMLLGATIYRRVKIDQDLNNPPLELHKRTTPPAEEVGP